MVDDVTGQLCVREQVEMSHDSVGDKGTTSTRWTHRAQNHQIFKAHELQGLTVIPPSMIQELTHQFERWLSSESLFLRHVEIIDKYDAFFADWRTIVALSSLLHLGIDCILSLVSTSLR